MHELDGVLVSVGRDAEVVDHVLDQEEAPAARLLQPFELRLEVGRLGLGDLALAALVGDADERARRLGGRTPISTGSSGRDSLPCSIAFIAASETAVLSRSSRAGSRPSGATASATRSLAPPLVAVLARDRERDVDVRRTARGRRAATRVSATSVMSSSCSQPAA